MKALVKREINIKNEEVVENCYTEFTEKISMAIQDFLMDDYNIDYDMADSITRNISKNDFVEIVTYYLEKVKNDKYF
jgi:hypothetical protein